MDHKWRKDRDGAESCEREGCTVRQSKTGRTWQRRKGTHWRHATVSGISPCTGKEAAEAKPAPSPLEVVREALLRLKLEAMNTARPGLQEQAIEALGSLATLEESTRADELAMAITQAEDDANNHPLTSTSMRLRVRLSELRGKAESLEKWEESIRKDEREKCHADALAVTCGTPRCVHSRCGGATAVARIIARRTRK